MVKFATLPTDYPTTFMVWVSIITILVVILFIITLWPTESIEGAEFTGDSYKAGLPFAGRRSDGAGDPRFVKSEGFMASESRAPNAWPYNVDAARATRAGAMYEGFNNNKSKGSYKGTFAESILRKSAQGM